MTMTPQVQSTLLANTLDIQVPGPGARREGDFFVDQLDERATPAPPRINADLLNWRAKREERRGRLARARELWRRCLEIDRADGRAYIALARDLERRKRDAAAAAELLAEGLRQDPSNPYVRQAYGVLLERTGDAREALAQLRLATRYDPSHVASHVATARLLTRDLRDAPLNRRPPADSEAAAAEARPFDDEWRLEPAPALARLPRADDAAKVAEARTSFERALKAEPKNYYALSCFADLEARGPGGNRTRRGGFETREISATF